MAVRVANSVGVFRQEFADHHRHRQARLELFEAQFVVPPSCVISLAARTASLLPLHRCSTQKDRRIRPQRERARRSESSAADDQRNALLKLCSWSRF
jgi:hypothetical protein